MGLQSLEIRDFRNIQKSFLSFSPGLNLISGANAAGKTSLLEAVYFLGRVRSFRAADSRRLIRYDQTGFRLIGRVSASVEDRSEVIGIERSPASLKVHAAGEVVRRLSDLAGRFPVQVISGDTQTILSGGPRYRRQTLDWALFHVEQRYRDIWQRYVRSLRQRNAALRLQAPRGQVQAWDAELLEVATRIDEFRRDYLDALQPHLLAEIHQLLPDSTPVLRYQAGWPSHSDLAEVLRQSIERDRAAGYTTHGPHRADFSILLNDRDVLLHCSRGQQKALVVGFLLAQVRLQQAQAASGGAFLLDDLGSELDGAHQARVLEALHDLKIQVFVTAIDAARIGLQAWPAVARFHVEHGEVRVSGDRS
jgi:DNA replication and repair protein RecF